MPKEDSLINFINKTSPEKLQVDEDLGCGYVRLNISEAQRRQAKHDIRSAEDALIELLRNSRDAKATQIYVAFWKENNQRSILVIDNGEGIPEQLQSKVFEPRVTSKLNSLVIDKYGVHGRGMALYGISENCLRSMVTTSKRGILTAIKLVINTKELPEKANQSTWPSFNSKGKIKEGPKNFVRNCLEFNIEHPGLLVYLGSPTQIMTTMLNSNQNLFANTKPESLHKKAKQLGLDISLRNCQRIAYGQVESLKSLLGKINYKKVPGRPGKNNISSLINHNDLLVLLDKVKEIFNEKGREYFVTVSDDANIIKVGNKLRINLPLEIKE